MAKTFVRIDDRLIHGQTIVAWCPMLSIQEIIAIDDESAKNPLLKSIMTMGAPSMYKTSIVTTEEAKEILSIESDRNRLLIMRFPNKLAEIKDEIMGCESIVLGNIAKRADTIHKVSGATGIFYLSENDVEILDDLNAKGMEIYFQQLPSTSKTNWAMFKNNK